MIPSVRGNSRKLRAVHSKRDPLVKASIKLWRGQMSELPLNSEEAFEAALSPPKFQIILPVMIDSANGVIEGYVDEMNEIEMRIVSLTHLPNLGEKCKVSFLLDQVTRAYAKVIGVDSVNRRFDMEISRFIENGQYILAILSKDVQDDNKR